VIAVWLSELARHVERLRSARARLAVVQLFGAAGTAAALGPKGRDVRHAVARRLGLGTVECARHRGTIEHVGRTIFRGLPSPLRVGRYHSLVVEPELPGCLEESARGGGVVMGVRHRELPAEGVQFHPESVLTDAGRELLANFLEPA